MSFTKSQLDKKSDAELAQIATDLGLDLSPESTSKAVYVASILQIQAEDARLNADASVVEEPAAVEAPQKKLRILVHNQEGVEATPFVKVQVNGTMYTLPREQEVTVPAEVVEVLNNAVVTRFVQEGRDLVEKPARRFPYTVLGEAK